VTGAASEVTTLWQDTSVNIIIIIIISSSSSSRTLSSAEDRPWHHRSWTRAVCVQGV